MVSVSNISTEEALEDLPSVDERRALIERVAGSVQLRRSARLRDFLLYVGGQSLKEGCPEIHEQEIGARVFGRPSTYDRSQDNIVRVNATELRKRIELYFASEGAHEPLIFDIPRGAYKLVFSRRLPESETPLPAEPPPHDTPLHQPETAPENKPQYRAHILWASATLVLAIACLTLFLQNNTMRKALYLWDGKPAVAAFWGDFLRYHQQTDIVLPDDSVSLIEDITHHPVSLGDYLNRSYMRKIQSLDISSDRKADLEGVAGHNLVTFGGVRAAQQILTLIPVSSTPRLTFSRFYVADEIKRNNAILIGGRKANPWVHLFDDRMNFITDYDDEHSQAFVRNRHRLPGEQAGYAAQMDLNALVGYSVIAYLPNPGRTGNVIILAGTDSDATSAAAEFLTSEDQLNTFRNTLHLQKFPYFEVLLKTSRLSGTSFSAEVLAYRTYPDLH